MDPPSLRTVVAAIREQNRILGLHFPTAGDGDGMQALPLVIRGMT